MPARGAARFPRGVDAMRQRKRIMTCSLPSSGLVWDEERLAARYAFLRRRRDEVTLELLYYPYWLFHVRGSATWRFFGERPLEGLLVCDACTGRCQRVSSFPEWREESVSFDGGGDPAHFAAEKLKENGEERQVSACVVPLKYGEAQAGEGAEAFALDLWRRRCNLPLGPRAAIRCTEKTSLFLYKPFWVMRPKKEPESGQGKMFVFDASTGLGGVSEYWNVVEYVLALSQRKSRVSE